MNKRLSVPLLSAVLLAAQAFALPAQDSWDADRDGHRDTTEFSEFGKYAEGSALFD